MILVDTSVWIDFLRGQTPRPAGPNEAEYLATCGPVVQELFQGLSPSRQTAAFSRELLALPLLSDPVPLALFQSAAGIFSQARSRGYTIRSSMDCLIAAIAIENHVPLWHRDRDFDLISRFTPLEITGPS